MYGGAGRQFLYTPTMYEILFGLFHTLLKAASKKEQPSIKFLFKCLPNPPPPHTIISGKSLRNTSKFMYEHFSFTDTTVHTGGMSDG